MLEIKKYKCKNCFNKYNNFITNDKLFCTKDCRTTYYLRLYNFNNKKLIHILN